MARFYQYNDNSYILPKEVNKILREGIPKVSHHIERDQLLVSIGWETGGRVSEVLDLQPEHVMPDEGATEENPDIGWIRLINLKQRHKPGTNPPNKMVFVSKQLTEWINRYVAREHIPAGQLIFHAVNDKTLPLGRDQVHRMITAASEAAGIYRLGKANPRTGGRWKGISYHVLRHSYAVEFLKHSNNTEEVAKQLGHSNILSTQAYLDVATSEVRSKVSKAKMHLYHP